MKIGLNELREKRIKLNVRVKDKDEDNVGRILLMKEKKVEKGEKEKKNICKIKIVMKEKIVINEGKYEYDIIEIEKN